MKNVILGAAYTGPKNGLSWIPTLAVIVIGIFIFIFLYKLILSKMNQSKQESETVEKVIVQSHIEPDEDGIMPIVEKEEDIEADEVIVTPMAGRLISIKEVPDPIFSEKMVGDGFAIEPSKSEILSPVNGHVMQIHSNKSAVTIKTKVGREVIMHIGLNSVSSKESAILFTIKEGDEVRAGQRIGEMNIGELIGKVSSTISPVVFPNLKDHERVVVKEMGIVEAGMKDIIVIEKEE